MRRRNATRLPGEVAWGSGMAQAPPGNDLIRRNRALLTRAAASRSRNRALLTRAAAARTYTALLREEAADTVLTAHLAQLRAWLLRRQRGALSLPKTLG
jgi:hypothetical protein